MFDDVTCLLQWNNLLLVTWHVKWRKYRRKLTVEQWCIRLLCLSALFNDALSSWVCISSNNTRWIMNDLERIRKEATWTLMDQGKVRENLSHGKCAGRNSNPVPSVCKSVALLLEPHRSLATEIRFIVCTQHANILSDIRFPKCTNRPVINTLRYIKLTKPHLYSVASCSWSLQIIAVRHIIFIPQDRAITTTLYDFTWLEEPTLSSGNKVRVI
jgi:hypothetical protein